MKKTLVLMCLVLALLAGAAENLLCNGDFAKMGNKVPFGWRISGKKCVVFNMDGPDGLRSATVTNASCMLRQSSLKLVPGKEYEVSAWVRVSGKKYGKCRLSVINNGWLLEEGINEDKFVMDGKWHRISKKFKLMESDSDWGFVAGFAAKEGTLSYAGITLTAVDPEVEKQCFNAYSMPLRNMIPYSPLLAYIPEEKPVLKMALGAKGKGPFFCLYQAGSLKEAKAAFRDGFADLDLKGLKPGKYTLTVKFTDQSGKILSQDQFPIVICQKVAVRTEGARRLNNLVISLAEQKVSGSAEIVFGNPREGWVWFGLPAGSKIQLDGKPVRYPEFVRYLSKGNHTLKLTGAGGKVSVHAIPEIMTYPLCGKNLIPGAGDFNWAFTRKYFLPASTTFSGGRFPESDAAEFKERGLDFLANLASVRQLTAPGKKEELLNRIQTQAFAKPYAAGCTMDEFGWCNPGELSAFARIVNNVPYPEGKRLYTWIAEDIPGKAMTFTDSLSILLNITGSRGMALYEAYCVQQRTLPEAEKYLSAMLNEHTAQVAASYPEAIGRLGIIMGNFNQMPVISLEAYPNCDYKYFLDMQCHILANHPVYKDLGCVGYWGTYYGDEEMARWSFRLLRHYAVEGNKEMLSPRFGFTFNADFLKDGDFEKGLKHWTASGPDVKTVKIGKLGDYERRWRRPTHDGCGSTCVLLKSGSSVRQTARGLVPGKLYSLKFCTGLYDVVKKEDRKAALADDGIRVTMKNVEELTDKRYDGGRKGGKKTQPPMMIHRRVFKAKGSTAEFIFSHDGAQKDNGSVMNFVQLVPYYSEK